MRYVLSPTHLHEFKSADRIASQSPVMSLYLPEQKLGTHSEPGSNSHKFMLKGRQTGSMHRGHSWIFRAETHDTMLAWYGDIKELTEKRGEARNEFVRRTHARTVSSSSLKAPSIGSAGSGMEDDEADVAPFSGEQSVRGHSITGDTAGGIGAGTAGYGAIDDSRSEPGWRPQRPTPGGRFPSDLNVQRGLQVPLSPSSGDSFDETDRDAIAAAGALPGSGLPFVGGMSTQPHTELQQPQDGFQQSHAPYSAPQQSENEQARAAGNFSNTAGISSYTAGDHRRVAPTSDGAVPIETASTYGEWMAPIGAGVAGAGLGVAGAQAHHRHHHHTQSQPEHIDDQQNAIPSPGQSSAPIATATAAPTNAPTRPRGMTDSTQDTTINTITSSHTASTVPTSIGTAVGTEAPAPSQTLLASGIDPHPMQAGTARISTGGFVGGESGADATGRIRPELLHSAKSVQTISELHVPGEFPRAAAAES